MERFGESGLHPGTGPGCKNHRGDSFWHPALHLIKRQSKSRLASQDSNLEQGLQRPL
jgi:hypothetical protein